MNRLDDLAAPPHPTVGDGPAPARERSDGSVNAAISNAVVGLFREYMGRGPTKARTSIRDNTVVVVMEDTLTKAEKVLATEGEQEAVLQMRRAMQATMRDALSDTVSRLTGRRVVAFMSDNSTEPDYAVEVFVLESAP